MLIIKEVYKWEGFQGGTSGKEPSCQSRRQKRRGFSPCVEKSPQRKLTVLAWKTIALYVLLQSK